MSAIADPLRQIRVRVMAEAWFSEKFGSTASPTRDSLPTTEEFIESAVSVP